MKTSLIERITSEVHKISDQLSISAIINDIITVIGISVKNHMGALVQL